MFKIRLAVTARNYFSTECSGYVPINTMSGLLDFIDNPPIR